MYRVIISLMILGLLSPLAAQAERTVVTQQPYYQPYYNSYDDPYYQPYNNYTNFSDLGALEKYALNKTFNRESPLQRLQRLETQAFGAVQSGDLDTRYENVREAILSRPKDNFRTSLLRNLSNYLSGQMTGFTPSFGSSNPYPYATSFNPMNTYSNPNAFSYNQFPTTYDNGRTMSYGNGPFKGGYTINNYGTGSSSGVRILD